MKPLGLTPGLEGKRVVVQGLGNVGYHAAKFCREAGAHRGGDRRARRRHPEPEGPERRGGVPAPQGRRRRSSTFPGRHPLASTAAALELECDILIPAALENQFTAENAPRVKAKIILEGANGPTTPDADDLPREGHPGHPRHLRQRRRRDGLLLRVAEEPVARALRAHGEAPRRGQRAADAARHRAGHRPALQRGAAGRRWPRAPTSSTW